MTPSTLPLLCYLTNWFLCFIYQTFLKEINPEYSLEGLMPEAEGLVLWPQDVKSRLIGKDPGARKNWGMRRRG